MLTQLLVLNKWLNSEWGPKALQQPVFCRHTLGLRVQVREFTGLHDERGWKTAVRRKDDIDKYETHLGKSLQLIVQVNVYLHHRSRL